MTPVKAAIFDQSVVTTDSQTRVATAMNSAGKTVLTCLDFGAAQRLTTETQKGKLLGKTMLSFLGKGRK